MHQDPDLPHDRLVQPPQLFASALVDLHVLDSNKVGVPLLRARLAIDLFSNLKARSVSKVPVKLQALGSNVWELTVRRSQDCAYVGFALNRASRVSGHCFSSIGDVTGIGRRGQFESIVVTPGFV